MGGAIVALDLETAWREGELTTLDALVPSARRRSPLTTGLSPDLVVRANSDWHAGVAGTIPSSRLACAQSTDSVRSYSVRSLPSRGLRATID